MLQRLEKGFLVYETDLSVRTQIEDLPMFPEFPSAARVSEYVCDLEYMFSRINVGSSGATEPHLWLMSINPTRTREDCPTTSERKSRTQTYDDLVDLLFELGLERENDPQMEKFLKKHLGRGGTPTPDRVSKRRRINTRNVYIRVPYRENTIQYAPAGGAVDWRQTRVPPQRMRLKTNKTRDFHVSAGCRHFGCTKILTVDPRHIALK